MSIDPVASTAPPGRSRTRVMVVDDSVVIRGLIARWLTEAGQFDVVTTAANGRIAVDALDRFKPDIVLLDLEMPEMDGVAALPLLLKRQPGIKVIVISTLTQRNAEISLKCLSLGAVDYLAKPESNRQASTSEDFRCDLVEKLKAHAGSRARSADAVSAPAATYLRPAAKPAHSRPQYLLIGASTGGPRAIEEVLTSLGPVAQRVPILIVQHMPAMFTAVFADHLRALLGMRVCEPRDGEGVLPGNIFVAPGGRHMGISSGPAHPVIRLDDRPPVNFCRPAVDVLFRDAATVLGPAALAVVLTGMGSDGTQGARALVATGAMVLAQDEATSTVWGMPGGVAKAGLAHDILPLEAIGPAVKGYITGSTL
ncbi:protein-glutamate methylesterase/protein-glutamine glutaminase [Microvirga terricola]|uniref:Protein-glutamate methylesterase/protein-glutamine glutaminase n=1 Tax=Microvirga terricola TaxID=2719797 RepID=A0ABX0VEY1_9HYPH|nr:chemotaxis response regulator protein-glutamate methylesterase [Microvirga terricola]NIX78400.1 chemotaxis response regulator protein-glutamate methylesterase [Microvirga terricola]